MVVEIKSNPSLAALPLAPPPGIAEWFSASFRIGCLSFGGAAGQIALMHRVFVEEKRWVSERDFLNGLNFCTLLPGPEAQQLATWIGWRLHGVRGGLISGILFVLPGAALILALAQAYVLGAEIPLVAGLLLGIKAAVIAIIIDALIKIARRALKTDTLRLTALVAFLALGFTAIPFPLVIILAGIVGAFRGKATAIVPSAPLPRAADTRAGFRVGGLMLVAWWLPVGIAAALLGSGHLLVEVGLFFSKLAVVTFGGAYALLAYLSDEAVRRGWADARQMIDALGLAETTPGPTILVNPFIAFLAGAKQSTAVGWLAGLMALWTTFAPSFLFIFAGGPFIERLNADRRLAGALAGISAAVVGIIGAVALKFALAFLFTAPWRYEAGAISALLPGGALDARAALLAGLAMVLLLGFRWRLLAMLATLSAIGVALTLGLPPG
jgi:chromate transporter